MNSKTREREKAHRKASEWAKGQSCANCGRGPCMPCHYPSEMGGHHRGMGAGKAGWELEELWPGCRRCHDLVDRRLTALNAGLEFEREIALKRLARYRRGQNVDPSEW